MFITLETERGEKVSINLNSIIFCCSGKKDKACVVLENDLTFTLNCSYEELQDKLKAADGI